MSIAPVGSTPAQPNANVLKPTHDADDPKPKVGSAAPKPGVAPKRRKPHHSVGVTAPKPASTESHSTDVSKPGFSIHV